MDKWKKAADIMTLTLSPEVKRKLTEEEFNNEFKMLARLTALLQPGGEAQFMRLTREYYTLRFDESSSETLSEFVTRVKVLEERIDVTNITMDNDKHTFLCLSMSLPSRFRSLIQIWSAMDGITAEKATAMLLKEERRTKDDLEQEIGPGFQPAALVVRLRRKCSYCGKQGHTEVYCWTKHPEQAPKDVDKSVVAFTL